MGSIFLTLYIEYCKNKWYTHLYIKTCWFQIIYHSLLLRSVECLKDYLNFVFYSIF